jgi:Subunit 21 of Mediator complex
MFEALRGLRDAVAPESGNLGVAVNDQMISPDTNKDPNNGTSKDVEELYRLYCSGDEDVVALVNDPKFNPERKPMRNSLSEFVQWHEDMEQQKDSELVERLASAVLEKSTEIDYAVDHKLPGMHRTRTEQMDHLRQLIAENAAVAQELGEAYKKAQVRRDQCRSFVIENTGKALGIGSK